MTPSFAENPSISTSIALSVCSCSEYPPPVYPPPVRERFWPMASISSMKMMHGECLLPCSNMSRTRLAPTPTNISMKSEPDIEKKGTPASPAIARARSVLPVPGGPTSRTPFGIFPPSFLNFAGALRNSMISWTSSLASSIPATSLNVVFFLSSVSSFARDLPTPNGPLPPRRLRKNRNHVRNTSRPITKSSLRSGPNGLERSRIGHDMPLSSRNFISSSFSPGTRRTRKFGAGFSLPSAVSSCEKPKRLLRRGFSADLSCPSR